MFPAFFGFPPKNTLPAYYGWDSTSWTATGATRTPTFNQTIFDNYAAYSQSGSAYVAPATGYYFVQAGWSGSSASGGVTNHSVTITKVTATGATSQIAISRNSSSGTTVTGLHATTVVYLNAGEKVYPTWSNGASVTFGIDNVYGGNYMMLMMLPTAIHSQ